MRGLYSIADMAIYNIKTDNNVKMCILREKWKEVFSDLAEFSQIVNFKEDTVYLKTYDSTLKHYIFVNKQDIIKKIFESLEVKFEIKDIKI